MHLTKLTLALSVTALVLSIGCVFSPKETCKGAGGSTCGTGGNGATGGTGGTGNTGNSPPVNCDKDGDGYKAATPECGGDDCDDNNAAKHPGAVEICGDGEDNNCDGHIDEGCACAPGDSQDCYSGPSDTENVGPCHAGTQVCTSGSWGACQNQQVPQNEICGNGVDDDCDGQVDEGCTVTNCDQDGDGHNAEGCHDNSGRPEDDCNDNDASIHPGATDICGDGIDQDCDGQDLACGPNLNHGCAVGSGERDVYVVWTPPANAPLDLDVVVQGGYMQQPGLQPQGGDFAQASRDPNTGSWTGFMDLKSGTYVEFTIFHHGTVCDGFVTDQCCYTCEGCGSDDGTVAVNISGTPLVCSHVTWDDAPAACNKHIACCIP